MNIKEIFKALDRLMDMTDPDGLCENGCACGECGNCIELEEIQEVLDTTRKELRSPLQKAGL